MLISDFIKELKEFKTDYGDIQVLMRDEYGNEDDFNCFSITSFNPYNDEYENVVILEM